MKKLIFSLILASFFSMCGDIEKPEIKLTVIQSSENMPEPTPEVTNMIAVLFYDGAMKALNDDYSITPLRSATNVVKVENDYLVDDNYENLDKSVKWPISVPAEKGIIYQGKLFYYGTDKKLYMCDLTTHESTEIYNNTNNYPVSLTNDGIVAGFNFFFPDGSFEQGQYWAQDTALKINKVGTIWHKYIYDFTNKKWIDVGQGYYSDFIKGAALILQDKIIFTRGATLENSVLLEPVYNLSNGIYVGGNAFTRFIQPNTLHPIFKAIGSIGDIGYFLNAMDGKIYKYDIVNDNIVEWIAIVTGTGDTDSINSENLFNMVNPFIVGNEIIYFDGTAIYRVNVDTGKKIEIAQATNFKGWSL